MQLATCCCTCCGIVSISVQNLILFVRIGVNLTCYSSFAAGGVDYISFAIPVLVGAGSFPFLGAPNRSLFSEAVDQTPELNGFAGTMQALLSVSYFSERVCSYS